jgi:hypothetical protein
MKQRNEPAQRRREKKPVSSYKKTMYHGVASFF